MCRHSLTYWPAPKLSATYLATQATFALILGGRALRHDRHQIIPNHIEFIETYLLAFLDHWPETLPHSSEAKAFTLEGEGAAAACSLIHAVTPHQNVDRLIRCAYGYPEEIRPLTRPSSYVVPGSGTKAVQPASSPALHIESATSAHLAASSCLCRVPMSLTNSQSSSSAPSTARAQVMKRSVQAAFDGRSISHFFFFFIVVVVVGIVRVQKLVASSSPSLSCYPVKIYGPAYRLICPHPEDLTPAPVDWPGSKR